ncbi:helix-turn-helix domain-containing protein [Dysgonomonas sp. HGC4]|uniref:helix-turn-helix domain-containing protein n=1 Tax=Dysgonomonas sp. HGC4 TaxID=1658009 RepID=UPI0006810659|nr:helix-turn-helix domain-containing protein [Dysgonomonas sp. HGC4]MBD8347831.1 hypothetical protein [Dysgonomonas sp. HGC4]
MKKRLNEIVVNNVRKHMPEGRSVVSFLMDLLDLAKESTYRRIRNEIPFTFEEISKIALYFNISLDEIVGQGSSNKRVFFHLRECESTNSILQLGEVMLEIIDILHKVRHANDSKVILAGNHFPMIFSLTFPNITKFRYYKWVHQVENVPLNFYYSDFSIPQEILNLQKELKYNFQRVSNLMILLDKNVILSIVMDANYFYKRNLISESELRVIQSELYECVDMVEEMTQKGVNQEGSEVLIYLSHLNIESNGSYFEYDGQAYSQLWSYFSVPISISNPQASFLHKKWLDSLKKYSTLITQSGEIQRSEFLNWQREIISNIDRDFLWKK